MNPRWPSIILKNYPLFYNYNYLGIGHYEEFIKFIYTFLVLLDDKKLKNTYSQYPHNSIIVSQPRAAKVM